MLKNCWIKSFRRFELLIVVLILTGCQSIPVDKSSSNLPSLYQQLGGATAIKIAVRKMVVRLHQDQKLSELFKETNDDELRQNFQDFICQLTDGGCEYQGAEMLDIHAELYITKGEFDHFVSLFIYSMEDANIPFDAQNKLLARLAKLRSEIIEL